MCCHGVFLIRVSAKRKEIAGGEEGGASCPRRLRLAVKVFVAVAHVVVDIFCVNVVVFVGVGVV